MPKIGRPHGAPPPVPGRPAGAPKTGETPQPRTSPSDHSTFASAPAQTSSKQAAQGQAQALGLPITTVVPGPDRMSGAVGAALAYQLTQLWKRQPGEKRIP